MTVSGTIFPFFGADPLVSGRSVVKGVLSVDIS
jgi:hypothetical protein